MYKTIRHGENSLQYTILPQNDDCRIEGKLSSAGSSCSSGSSKKSRAKRPKRRSFFAYLGLIFVCTVIIGAILVPFLVSAECLPNPTEWFLKTKAALTKGANGNGSNGGGSSGKELKNLNGSVINIGHNNVNTRNLVGTGINIGKTVKIINKDGVEKIILRVNKTLINDNLKTEVDQIKPIENAGNINISNKNSNFIEKLTNGNAVKHINENDNARVKPMEMQERENGEKVIDSNSSANTAINDNEKSVSILNNNEPVIQSEHFVTQVRFDSSKIISAITPINTVVTTVRSNYDYNINDDNNNRIDIANVNNVEQQILTKQQYTAAVQTASASAPVIRPTSTFSATSAYSPHAPSNPNSQLNPDINAAPAIPIPTITTRIIQVPLLKSAAKKPVIPPVLVKTNSELSTNKKNYNVAAAATTTNRNSLITGTGDTANSLAENVSNVDEKSKNSDWIHSHWPYIDPSTYFQWTGYKAEDSVLLPALLGFALIGMILIITVCLVARNKRTIVSSVRKRNNDIEETGADDNATLLAPANLSDED